MTKEINTLNMDSRVWERLNEQAKLMKRSRSEFVEQVFAEAFGIVDLIPQPRNTIKIKDL